MTHAIIAAVIGFAAGLPAACCAAEALHRAGRRAGRLADPAPMSRPDCPRCSTRILADAFSLGCVCEHDCGVPHCIGVINEALAAIKTGESQ